MCHPGHADAALVEGSTYAKEREKELAIALRPGRPRSRRKERHRARRFRQPLKVFVERSAAAAARLAAAEAIAALLRDREPRVLALSTGRTMVPIYAELVRLARAGLAPFGPGDVVQRGRALRPGLRSPQLQVLHGAAPLRPCPLAASAHPLSRRRRRGPAQRGRTVRARARGRRRLRPRSPRPRRQRPHRVSRARASSSAADLARAALGLDPPRSRGVGRASGPGAGPDDGPRDDPHGAADSARRNGPGEGPDPRGGLSAAL